MLVEDLVLDADVDVSDSELDALNGGLGNPLYDGLACVGGNTRRFPLDFVGPDGTVGLVGPASIYPLQIVPGSTWNFQFWYRDNTGSPCGTGANLTNAVSIDFQP